MKYMDILNKEYGISSLWRAIFPWSSLQWQIQNVAKIRQSFNGRGTKCHLKGFSVLQEAPLHNNVDPYSVADIPKVAPKMRGIISTDECHYIEEAAT